MTFREIANKIEKLTTDHSQMILTVVGVAGTVSTAFLTGNGAFKAAEIIRRDRETGAGEYEPTTLNNLKLTWKCYVPAVSSGAVTVGAIIAANRIGTRRAAAMAAAYTLSDKSFAEYKEKVKKELGLKKEEAIRDDIQQDRVNTNPPPTNLYVSGSEQICFDPLSGRYFTSTMEDLKAGMNAVNYTINQEGYASLSDFYDNIGLDRNELSEELGWNQGKLLEIHFTTVMTPDQKPAIALEYRVMPVRNYFRMS